MPAPIFARSPTLIGPSSLAPGADHHVVAHGRVALAALEAGAAEGHLLVERHVVADLGGLADHHAGAVVDERAAADVGRGVDLHSGQGARGRGQQARRERDARIVHHVGDAVGEQRLHAAVGEEDLDPAHVAGRGIAVLRGGEVLAQLARDTGEGAEAEHA